MPPPTDRDYMARALALAEEAARGGEVPVGAIVVHNGRIVAEGYNRPVSTFDPTAHAEMVALREAGRMRRSYRLLECDLYVTLEPCLMCAAAMVHARLRRVVFGAFDPKAGAAGSIIDAFALPQLNHRVDVFGGVLEQECGQLLSGFFASRRGSSPRS